MKKMFCVVCLMLLAVLSACSKADEVSVPVDVNEVVNGETENVPTTESSDSKIVEFIKATNKNAVVEESFNPGLSMLKTELPSDKDVNEKAEGFFKEVLSIVENINNNSDSGYDFYYFSTSENGAVVISVAFKLDNDKLVLESINGIGENYTNAAEVAQKVSPVFVEAE